MTAEIAIINRSAVTLAADSALSLGEKVFTSADKIFEFSKKCPIGVMLYNSLDFMGVPLDVLVKKFRDESDHGVFNSVEEAAECFFDFLGNIDTTIEHERQSVLYILYYELQKIRHEYEEVVEYAIFVNKQAKTKSKYDFAKLFTGLLISKIREIRKRAWSECLWDIDQKMVLSAYDSVVGRAIDKAFTFPILPRQRELLREIAALTILTDHYSEIDTGLVFAGFGKDDLFPSLVSYQMDGAIFGRIKRKMNRKIVLDRTSNDAEIVAFAQHEMADRFLDAIDPEFEKAISGFMSDTLSKTSNAIIDGIPRLSKRTRADLRQKAKEAVNTAVADFESRVSGDIRGRFRSEILGIVSGMPKPDLASFAEALVNITSIKRKVSAQQESVAGPIDVAIISRSDGFVWVKRKHYFDPSLNHRYFHRKYSMLPSRLERREP